MVSANAGERERLSRENRQSCWIQSGCARPKERRKSPGGIRTTAARPNGCKARQVRLTHAGVGSRAVATPTRRRLTTSGVLPRKADHEKLNDERGVKPLPVNPSRDGAESGKDGAGWVWKRFCILLPEISGPRPLETMTRWEPRTCLTGTDPTVLTDVTAGVKSPTNRARSVAAGVVSGAGWGQPVFQRPHSDESASSRISAS